MGSAGSNRWSHLQAPETAFLRTSALACSVEDFLARLAPNGERQLEETVEPSPSRGGQLLVGPRWSVPAARAGLL
jgi:hypothetical protein